MRKINHLIIHHSASPYGCTSVIRDWHLHRQPPFKDCGYHAIINSGFLYPSRIYDVAMDGAIEIGRPWQQIGAHAQGHNTDSLGICLIGFGPDFSRAQYASLKQLLQMLRAIWPHATIMGHRAVGQTECPGFDVGAWCRREGL